MVVARHCQMLSNFVYKLRGTFSFSKNLFENKLKMAQGKMKVKSKLPSGVKSKVKKTKGKAVTKRINAPVKSKTKAQTVERNKMKATVTKMVNAAAEQQLRALATDTPQLSEAQKRVASAPTAPAPALNLKMLKQCNVHRLFNGPLPRSFKLRTYPVVENVFK